jgi:uncharacterized membrane protein YraQ (UPF0718 family)
MAVIIAMLSTALPWGPIMAFLTSSPLMSPEEFVMISGIIGVKFAIALTCASVIIGLGSGYLSHLIEQKTGFLKDQIRFTANRNEADCNCVSNVSTTRESCCCMAMEINPVSIGSGGACCVVQPVVKADIFNPIRNFLRNIKWREIWENLIEVGVKQILIYFTIFVAIGYLINHFVATSLIKALFNAKSIFAVPLAALIGLPLYVNGETSVPLIKALMDGGVGGGAMLAFMITGPGTSAGVIAGLGTILKKRALILYVLFLLVGAVMLGYLYDLLLAVGV